MRFLTLIFLLPAIFCMAQEKNTSITINFSEDINDSVFLFVNKEKFTAFETGSTVVFDVDVKEATKVSVQVKRSVCFLSFYTDPGAVEIKASFFEIDNGRPCIGLNQITGSRTADDLEEFENQRKKIEKKFVAHAAKKNLQKLSFDMVKKYSSSTASIDIIYRVYETLGREWTEEALNMVDDSISIIVKDRILKNFNSAEYLQKGNQLDFTQNDINGDPFTLSSLKGKYVLIDFWASWCVPCRKENPKLKQLYNAYNEKGLEIVGVSLDDNEDKWKYAVEKDELPWIQVSDLKGWRNEISSTLGIKSIPFTILLDPEGKIVFYALRGNELEKAVGKALGKE